LRYLCLFFVLFQTHAHGASSETARVMLETIPKNTQIQGAFRVTCLMKSENQPLRPISCQRNHQRSQASEPKKNKHAAVQFRNSRFTVVESPSGVQFRIGNGRTLIGFHGEAFRFEGQFLWQGRKVKKLDLLPSAGASQWIVHLPLEEYLQGVLGGEVPASWPMAALKAQAVASRTYFLWKQDLKHRYYDVRSDHLDQVFRIHKKPSPSIVKAIQSTKGLFLHSPLTRSIFPAFFHADCGGDTATEHSVWRHPASENQPIQDRFCQSAKRNAWKRTLPVAEIQERLKATMILPRGAKLNAVIPRGQSGQRAHHVDFLFNNNIIKTLSANDFRERLGYGKIKSTRFKVVKKDDHFVFEGQGYGHGVGLCQWGAKRWAVMGKNFRQILAHYYPAAQLKKRRASTFPSVAER